MRKLPKISDAEWEIMKVIWEKSPITARTVVETLSSKKDWNPRTIRTMLNRLVRKGALDFRTNGKTYLYYPNVKKEDCLQQESESFLKRVFDGALTPMILHFVENTSLSEEDIRELKKILSEKKI